MQARFAFYLASRIINLSYILFLIRKTNTTCNLLDYLQYTRTLIHHLKIEFKDCTRNFSSNVKTKMRWKCYNDLGGDYSADKRWRWRFLTYIITENPNRTRTNASISKNYSKKFQHPQFFVVSNEFLSTLSFKFCFNYIVASSLVSILEIPFHLLTVGPFFDEFHGTLFCGLFRSSIHVCLLASAQRSQVQNFSSFSTTSVNTDF